MTRAATGRTTGGVDDVAATLRLGRVRAALAALAVAAVVAVVWRPANVGLADTALVLASTAVIVAGCLWFVARHRHLGVPLFPFTLLFYFAAFVLPAYYVDFVWRDGPSIVLLGLIVPDVGYLASTTALFVVFCGVASYTGAFVVVREIAARRVGHLTLPRHYNDRRLIALLAALLAIYLAEVLVPSVAALPSIERLTVPGSLVVIGCAIALHSEGRIGRATWAAALAGISLGLLADLMQQWALTGMVFVGLFGVLVYVRINRRVPFFFLVAVLLVFSILYSGVQYYRVLKANDQIEAVFGESAGLGHFANLAAITRHLWIGSDQHHLHGVGASRIVAQGVKSVRAPLRRVALLPLLSHVVDMTPAEVPCWRGESYRNLLANFVPRPLWPGKPEERLGNEVGQRYFLLHESDRVTSVNLPWLVEVYANFGFAGAVFGMALLGLLMALLDRLLNAPEMTPLETVVGAAVLFPLAYQESNFTVMTGSVPALVLSLYVYFRVGLTVGAGRPREP